MARKKLLLEDVVDYFWVAPVVDAKSALKRGAHALRMRQPTEPKAARTRKGKTQAEPGEKA